ncbi:MAG: sigma-E processing peptidase SpoIIGA [Oscillospiraceae bacterium]|nr:sigma-E processing peptidase SpoIIGA [Oscillospiraceae bacterium]
MIVYADALLALNLLLDYCLLRLTAQVAACPFSRPRLGLGALFGALYALLIFLPGLDWLAAWPLRLLSGAGMAAIAFYGTERFRRVLGAFFALTAALGGGVLALTGLGGATFLRGTVTTGADFLAVLAAGSCCCAALGWLFRRRLSRTVGGMAEVRVKLQGETVTFRALVDTGNTLTDRRNRPVLVADWRVLRRLLPRAGLEQADFAAPERGFAKALAALPPGRVQLVVYHTVGVGQALLLAVEPEEIWVDGKRRSMLLAGTAEPVSDGGDYQGLVAPEGRGA